jgi:HAD superfamily hydrolase (TIGR01509 family)
MNLVQYRYPVGITKRPIKMNDPGIKNLLLDLGGVLIDVDYHRTAKAFENLGAQHFVQLYSQQHATPEFEELEIGKLADDEFITRMQTRCTPGTTKQQVEDAWNAILLDFRMETIDYLTVLQKRYRLFLLSNTNNIHHRAFEKKFREQTGLDSLDVFFDRALYSHKIGMRKPHINTYKKVMEMLGIQGGETLFIDDSTVNIRPAAEAGLHTRLLKADETLPGIGLI